MATTKKKTNVKKKQVTSKKTVTNQKKVTNKKADTKKSDVKRKNVNFNLLLIFAFCIGLVLIVVTYAWFSSSLNGTVDFVTISVNRETGLYISLDGVEYGSSITIDEDIITDSLVSSYPDHYNKWPVAGLVPISSNGPSGDDTFDFFYTDKLEYKDKYRTRKYLDVVAVDEKNSTSNAGFLAFDIFLKNISNSSKPDNLYLYEGTGMYLNDGYQSELPGMFNSTRIGIMKVGHTPDKNATAAEVQALTCISDCDYSIYEPNHDVHTEYSIREADQLGITIVDGEPTNTYAVIKEGENLWHDTGHKGIPLDEEHFALQETYTDLSQSLFEIPHGVMKVRVYIWIEGQDLDALETISMGGSMNVTLNFYKDLAGYDL